MQARGAGSVCPIRRGYEQMGGLVTSVGENAKKIIEADSRTGSEVSASRPAFRIALERGGERGVVSDHPILPKLDNQRIWTGPGLCLLVVVIGSNYPDFLRLLFAMGRDLLLAGNATTVPADESLSCLSATAVLSADDFSLDSGAD